MAGISQNKQKLYFHCGPSTKIKCSRNTIGSSEKNMVMIMILIIITKLIKVIIK